MNKILKGLGTWLTSTKPEDKPTQALAGCIVGLVGVACMVVTLIPASLSIYGFVLYQAQVLSQWNPTVVFGVFLGALVLAAIGYLLWVRSQQTGPAPQNGNIPAAHSLNIAVGVYIIVFATICVVAIAQLLPFELSDAAPPDQTAGEETTPEPEPEATLEPGQSSVTTEVPSAGSAEANALLPANFTLLGIAVSLNAESRLLLLVIFSGTLGGLIKSLQSYRQYTGEQKLVASWIPFIITQPFVGGGLAVLFYLLIRGGLFMPSDSSSANRMGFVAISGMVGLFSEQALGKLSKIADSIFDPIKPGSDALTAPIADFTASVTTGPAPLTVQFTDDSTGEITDYSWDFGDGGTSKKESLEYTFNNAGEFTVKLTVTGPGGEASKTKDITVTPIADFTASVTTGPAPLTVQFTNTSKGDNITNAWDFGDGASTDASPQHNFTKVGPNTVTLTVTDTGGRTASKEMVITVK